MKKLFLALLLLPTVAYTSEKVPLFNEALKNFTRLSENRKKELQDPEYLKFILGNKLDLHIYGVLTPGFAQVVVQKAHENLVSELKKRKNHGEAGKSLTATTDAPIVNTCATMEQNFRKNGNVGMISGHSQFLGDNVVGHYLTSCNFNGERFFNNACPCDFYKKLTNEQLEQLRKGTQEAGK
jgi:hypothetical protein